MCLATLTAVVTGSCGSHSPGPPALTSATDAEEKQRAIDRVASIKTIVIRVDRIDAKLVTRGELHRVLGDRDFAPEMPADVRVWVVAVEGVISRNRGPLATDPFRWAVFVLDRSSFEPIATQYGSDGAWPAHFDQLRTS